MTSFARAIAVVVVAAFGLVMAVASCDDEKRGCLFETDPCTGASEPTGSAPPAPTFAPSPADLDSGMAACKGQVGYQVADGGSVDGGAAPGLLCTSATDCAPIRCACPVTDAGDAGDAGDADAEAGLLTSVDIQACVCSERCATSEEACSVAPEACH